MVSVSFVVDDVLPFSAQVKDPATGNLANAGSMTLTVTRPDGTAEPGSPFPVTPTSTGIYDKDVLAVQAGRYVGRWVATGANAGSSPPQIFDVRPADPGHIVSLADVKNHLGIPLTTTTHDDELEGWIEATTKVVESHPEYGRGPVLPRTVVEDHDGGDHVVYLNQSPVLSLTSIVPVHTGGTAVTVGDLDVQSSGKVQYLAAGTRFPSGSYRWTYRAGYTVVPANLIRAALIIVKGAWETQRGAGAASTLQAGGGEWVEAPGMGLYMYRAKLWLDATPRTAVVA